MFYGHALRPSWSPLPIILVLLAFWVAWPLGLALLVAFLFWGHHIRHLRSNFDGMCRNSAWSDWGRGPTGNARTGFGYGGGRSGNSAFDDYRDAELRRLDEERRKLDDERREFEQYVHDLRRARDKEEFDRFMAERDKRTKPKGDTIDL